MEIKKRLIMPGSAEVNAVLLNDEGEEYPVFLESLHNTIIFPLLLESGYKLTSLPYGFVKNGVAFDSLPTEQYSCDDIMLERMYNSIGAKLPYDELKAKMDVQEVQGRPIPPTNYTIHTREELLHYLDMTSKASLEEDFLPLNYFVAPEARFNVKEFQSLEYRHYAQLIDNRRVMSVNKFRRLVEWLKNFGLPANYTVQDILDTYFAWGFDGVDFTVINLRRENRSTMLHPNRNINAPVIRKTHGLIDKMGNMLTPQNERDVVWKLPSNDPAYISDITADLPGFNDTKVVEYHCSDRQDVTILEGTQFNITYSADTLIMLQRTYTPLRVESPVELGSYIDTKLALPNNEEALYEYCLMMALASMLYDMRKPRVRVSSYDALRINGCNPKTALDYIITQFDLSKDSRNMTEDDVPRIYDSDLNAYLNGTCNDENVKSFLQDVINGMFNIDNIAKAKEIEAMVSTQSVFKEIYAIHNVLGIPLKEIYDKFRSITSDMQVLTFSNGQSQHTMDVSQLRFTINGYIHDVQTYDMDKAKDCTFFTYVTLVARETGADDCRRHVGVEFYMVDKNKKAVKEILEELGTMYENKVYSTIADVNKQVKAMQRKDMFVLNRYFEVALKGTITWPDYLGGGSQPAMPSQQAIAASHMVTKIESTTTLCLFSTNSLNASSLSFNGYCVNAYITPEYVIPRGKSPIKEVAFNTAWFDWEHENPGVFAQLVQLGVLPAGFKSWSFRYPTQQFLERDVTDFENINSLDYYFTNAQREVNSFPVDMEFVSATHPVEYMYPGIYEDEEVELKPLPAPRTGAPIVRLGVTRDITVDDYRDILYPSVIEEADQYIVPFHGFTAEAFILVPDVYKRLPKDTGYQLTVSPASGTVYVVDTQQIINFRRITELDMNKYPITHLYGRMYLLRASNGRIWEVRI